MGKRYLIDSNVLIEFIAKLLPEPAYTALAKIIDEEFNISFISKIEVLGHSLADDNLREFVKLANVYDINSELIDATIELRLKQKIKLPDAIIAATALVYELVLITRNVNDFKNIPGLQVVNSWELSSPG